MKSTLEKSDQRAERTTNAFQPPPPQRPRLLPSSGIKYSSPGEMKTKGTPSPRPKALPQTRTTPRSACASWVTVAMVRKAPPIARGTDPELVVQDMLRTDRDLSCRSMSESPKCHAILSSCKGLSDITSEQVKIGSFHTLIRLSCTLIYAICLPSHSSHPIKKAPHVIRKRCML